VRAAELGIARLKIHDIRGSRADACQKILYPTPIEISRRVSLGALALKLVVDEDAEMLPKISGRIARRKPATVGRSTGPRPQTPPQLVPSTVVVPAMTPGGRIVQFRPSSEAKWRRE
jgi:hypothetical protein